MSAKPPFLTLARRPDLDQETAFTICRMIDSVGWELVENWDWNWLEGKKKDYRKLIDPAWLDGAWKLLFAKDWYSEQTTNDTDKRISTISPLEGLVNLQSLVLQNNLIEDLQPLSTMTRLKYLNCFENRIRDLTVLRKFPHLEELSVAYNPIESFRVLETLPRLRKLNLSPDQIPVFTKCQRLSKVDNLYIGIDGAVADFTRFPEMPSLRCLHVWHAQNLAGLERFPLLENLHLTAGKFSSLEPLKGLKALTHLSISTSKPLNVEILGGLFALRSLVVIGKKVEGLTALEKLPVLHEIGMDDETTCDAQELKSLRKGLTSWDDEFKTDSKKKKRSLEIEVVDQATFDYYDSKAPYGIQSDEHDEDMRGSEANWLVEEIRQALSVKFEEEKDFHLPHTGGFQRSERVILYGVEAYEALREVVTSIQRILCETRNDWIIWCQSLLWESPEEQDIPEGTEDFIIWIYPNKIMVAEEHAETVRKLIDWKN